MAARRALDIATATAVTALAEVTAPSATKNARDSQCTVLNLPKDGFVVLNPTSTITLAQDAVYTNHCRAYATTEVNSTLLVEGSMRDPFLASTIPQIFVLGAMLFLAWVLVFILVITPRTFFIVGSNGGGVLGRRGILGGATGTSTVIGVGGRPWLQKAATLGVGISLLIATRNSFNVAAGQYAQGREDAKELTNEVVGSTELQIIRIVSFTFLWLAQVQTLIRLFPRHKEKIIIKWIGFALIFLDTLFAILNNFVYKKPFMDDQTFEEAIPALAYTFQLVLNFVYLCAVLAYSWAKRRFAFYHPKMRNVAVVALLSLCSIVVPVVFFVLDVVNTVFIGWGDYCRWVGAAAASVVVWEWVERIEALEREDRKDGILGREIFESDEQPYSSSAIELRWPRNRRLGPRKWSSGGSGSGSSDDKNDGGGSYGSGLSGSTLFQKAFPSSLLFWRRGAPNDPGNEKTSPQSKAHQAHPPATNTVLGRAVEAEPIQVPQQVASPVSRADTTSAASTLYAVIHHPTHDSHAGTPINHPQSRHSPSNGTPPSQPQPQYTQSASHDFFPMPQNHINNPTNTTSTTKNNINSDNNNSPENRQTINATRADPLNIPQPQQITPPPPHPDAPIGISHNPFSRSAIHNPFKRQRTAPPPEVTAAMSQSDGDRRNIPVQSTRKRDRLRGWKSSNQVVASELPTFIIPAREGGGAWSPQEVQGSNGEGWITQKSRDMDSGGATNTTTTFANAATASNSNNDGHENPDAGSVGEQRSGSQNSSPTGVTQMPSIDGLVHTHTPNSVSPPSSRSTPRSTNSNQSTPSPRPPASGETGRMPVLEEGAASGAVRT